MLVAIAKTFTSFSRVMHTSTCVRMFNKHTYLDVNSSDGQYKVNARCDDENEERKVENGGRRMEAGELMLENGGWKGRPRTKPEGSGKKYKAHLTN